LLKNAEWFDIKMHYAKSREASRVVVNENYNIRTELKRKVAETSIVGIGGAL